MVFGSMIDVIYYSIQYFSDDDLLVIVSYLKFLLVGKDDLFMFDSECLLVVLVDLYSLWGGFGYVQFCFDCYCKDGSGVLGMFLLLVGNFMVVLVNLSMLLYIIFIGWKIVQIVIYLWVYIMFGFVQLEDCEIVEIFSFVCSSWGNQGLLIDVGQVKKLCQQIEVGNGLVMIFVFLCLVDMFVVLNVEQVVCGMCLYLEICELLLVNVGNQLNCISCYLNVGIVVDGLFFVGVLVFFFSYVLWVGKVIGLEECINGCFWCLMNGKFLLLDFVDMQVMVVYFDWMKNNIWLQDKVVGCGVGKVDLVLKFDLENGCKVYV